jgi:hypothetical protein
MKTQSQLFPVTRELVPEDQRLEMTEKIFGMRYVLELEPVIFNITERMAEDYKGGYWDFYLLSNGGFYLSLAEEKTYQVSCENFFEGNLSADALSISACLISYSHLSFGGDAYAHNYADQFYKLREFMLNHPEVKQILGATD